VALSWLFLPISIMVVGTRLSEAAALPVELISGLALAAILLYLPFLQINFAIDNSLRSGFDLRRVRQQFDRAPIALWIGLLATLALALPLYVLKAELVPREAIWLPSIVFIVSILPARLLVGWALGRSRRQEKKRHLLFRWSARLATVPVVLTYVLVAYFTQYISWYGAWSLFEQHAFMLPVPFVGRMH